MSEINLFSRRKHNSVTFYGAKSWGNCILCMIKPTSPSGNESTWGVFMIYLWYMGRTLKTCISLFQQEAAFLIYVLTFFSVFFFPEQLLVNLSPLKQCRFITMYNMWCIHAHFYGTTWLYIGLELDPVWTAVSADSLFLLQTPSCLSSGSPSGAVFCGDHWAAVGEGGKKVPFCHWTF